MPCGYTDEQMQKLQAGRRLRVPPYAGGGGGYAGHLQPYGPRRLYAGLGDLESWTSWGNMATWQKGVVVGGSALLLLIIVAVVMYMYRRRKRKA